MWFLIGLVLGIGIGSFLAYVYLEIMITGTEQLLSEKAPKSQQEVL